VVTIILASTPKIDKAFTINTDNKFVSGITDLFKASFVKIRDVDFDIDDGESIHVTLNVHVVGLDFKSIKTLIQSSAFSEMVSQCAGFYVVASYLAATDVTDAHKVCVLEHRALSSQVDCHLCTSTESSKASCTTQCPNFNEKADNSEFVFQFSGGRATSY
jgi:hypothetical protein